MFLNQTIVVQTLQTILELRFEYPHSAQTVYSNGGRGQIERIDWNITFLKKINSDFY